MASIYGWTLPSEYSRPPSRSFQRTSVITAVVGMTLTGRTRLPNNVLISVDFPKFEMTGQHEPEQGFVGYPARISSRSSPICWRSR
jgi:hypothetical protein